MQWHLYLFSIYVHFPGTECHAEGARSRSAGVVVHDPQGKFCSQLGSSHDQCDAHPHKCQWNWYGHGHSQNGCAKTECLGKDEGSCDAAERCIWKAAGRWKGQCVANTCGWRNDNPRKCDTRPCKQCHFDHALQACLPNPDELSANGSPKRTRSNMWQLDWAPGSGTVTVSKDADDTASLEVPECKSRSTQGQCDALANKCLWSDNHGCISSGCGYWKSADECIGACTWESEGQWKGLCVTNICIRHNGSPRSCNDISGCQYSSSLKSCISLPMNSPRNRLRIQAVQAGLQNASIVNHQDSELPLPTRSQRLSVATSETVALLLCVAVITSLVALFLHGGPYWDGKMRLLRQMKA